MQWLIVVNAPIMGGAEKHAFDLADAFAGAGVRASLFAMRPGALPPPRGVALDQPTPNRRFPGRVVDLAHRIARARPNLIIAVNERSALAAMIARSLCSRARPPVAMIWHSTRPRNVKEAVMSFLQRPILNQLDGMAFVSSNQRAFWRRRGWRPQREATIRNGVDLASYAPSARARWREETRRAIACPDAALLLGLNAVMRPEKNHLQLIDVLAELRARGVDARALLVGDGPMRSGIVARAVARGVADKLSITGMVADVRPWVAAFDIGVLCSTSIEALSLSALETMAMGIPMVMSNLGGADEIIDGANGRLFPVGDLGGFSAALEALSEAGAREAAGRAARATTVARFDQRQMIDGYISWFNQLARSS